MNHHHPCECSNCVYLAEIAKALKEIAKLLDTRPRTAKLYIVTRKGKTDMPLTVSIGATGTAVLNEFDAQNNQVPDVGPVTYSSSAPNVATVDPNSGAWSAVAAGTTTISGSDAGDNLTGSDTLTVTDPAVSATLVMTSNSVASAAKKG